MSAIDKLLKIAENEIGYLEKRTNSNLYDKTNNAGSGNFTKYWADIYPKFQGSAWCACFVTWCMVEAFGKDMTRTLLKHYPFTYCPTLASLLTKYSTPKRGDIVLFYRNSEFVHTGFVISVNNDYFETIEGNTSGGSTIIPNGGGVCKKGYFLNNLNGTKFVRPNYSLIISEEDQPMTVEEKQRVDNIENKITSLTNTLNDHLGQAQPMIYNYIDDNMPSWAKPTIKKLADSGVLKGNENGELGLTYDFMRILVILDRLSKF